QNRPDISGIVDAVQVQAHGAERLLCPALLVDRERSGAGSEARGAREQLGLDLDPRQTAARGAIALDGMPSVRVGRPEQVLAFGDEPPSAVARAPALAELSDLLELLVVLARD